MFRTFWHSKSVAPQNKRLSSMLGHMRIMLGTYVNIELANLLIKRILLVIG